MKKKEKWRLVQFVCSIFSPSICFPVPVPFFQILGGVEFWVAIFVGAVREPALGEPGKLDGAGKKNGDWYNLSVLISRLRFGSRYLSPFFDLRISDDSEKSEKSVAENLGGVV